MKKIEVISATIAIFSILALCSIAFCLLKRFKKLISNEPFFQQRCASKCHSLKKKYILRYYSSILPLKRNLLTHLDGLFVSSLAVGVSGQVDRIVLSLMFVLEFLSSQYLVYYLYLKANFLTHYDEFFA